MRSCRRYLLTVVLVLALCLSVLGCATARHSSAEPTALDRYVQAPDPTYAYHLEKTIPGDGVTTYILSMTSQTWRSPAEVNRPVWHHWLIIQKPEKVVSNKALLFITGGSIDSPPPNDVDSKIVGIAKATGTVVAQLRGVPNEPLIFVGDETRKRTEDELIAYTWDKYLKTGDANWLARLPMTKSAVRAMDTVTSFCAGEECGKLNVNQFVVGGSSKRGWTTWTTAAVDKRVVAAIPIVINLLNLVPSFQHHWQAYGKWAPAVGDYTDMNLMDWMGTPEYDAMLKIIEPYEYRDRYTMPKLIINATGDEFFLPDSTRFYWDDLPGENNLFMVPNGNHGLKETYAPQSILAFYDAIVRDVPRPRFSWTFEKDGSIRVTTQDKPQEVALWQATNPDARDFQIDTIGKAWTSQKLEDQGNGVYIARVPKPEKGWTAFMAELTYDLGGPVPLKVTTETRVVPDTLPYPPFKPAATLKGFMSK